MSLNSGLLISKWVIYKQCMFDMVTTLWLTINPNQFQTLSNYCFGECHHLSSSQGKHVLNARTGHETY